VTITASRRPEARPTVRGPDAARPRHWTFALRAAVAVVLVVGLLHAAVGWYVGDEIVGSLRVQPPGQTTYDTEVVAFADGTITLDRPDEVDLVADRDAVLGLSWSGGYGQVGPTEDADGGIEVRPFALIDGTPPAPGDLVDVDAFAFPADPARAGFDHEVVRYPGPTGRLEAWYLPGESATWLVAVHGIGAPRHEFLRLADATRDLGHPTLIVSYRGDPGAPGTAGSLILAGQDEWPDVAAAVDHARQQGAEGVVVYGASMGAGLALAYAVEAEPDDLRGLILESPNVDLREVVRLRASEALPVGEPAATSLIAAGRAVASLRTGIDFDAVDYVARTEELEVPVLVFHGAMDPKIPVEVVAGFAAQRPDLIEFHRLDDGAHVRAWNEDPQAYATTVADFLGRTAGD
jgi:uncharacterized protein